ncbi:Elongator subunit elp6 [Phlyctochytrium planicorne]|nr:Elongator subunit elp6 [Phlyctochytrium planicorne]
MNNDQNSMPEYYANMAANFATNHHGHMVTGNPFATVDPAIFNSGLLDQIIQATLAIPASADNLSEVTPQPKKSRAQQTMENCIAALNRGEPIDQFLDTPSRKRLQRKNRTRPSYNVVAIPRLWNCQEKFLPPIPMFTSIEAALCFTPSEHPIPRFYLITDSIRSDAFFLLHFFLGRALKRVVGDARLARKDLDGVVVVGMGERVKLETVGRKMGYTTSHTPPRYSYVDCAPNLLSLEGPFSLKSDSSIPASAPSTTTSLTPPPSPSADHLKSLYLSVVASFEALAKEFTDLEMRPIIVVEDASALVSGGFKSEDVYSFIMALRHWVAKLGGDIVVLIHNNEAISGNPSPGSRDHDMLLLLNRLHHVCDARLDVDGLESGYTDKVTGQILIRRGPRNDMDTKFIPQTLLFHVADTGVKFYPLGSHQVL